MSTSSLELLEPKTEAAEPKAEPKTQIAPRRFVPADVNVASAKIKRALIADGNRKFLANLEDLVHKYNYDADTTSNPYQMLSFFISSSYHGINAAVSDDRKGIIIDGTCYTDETMTRADTCRRIAETVKNKGKKSGSAYDIAIIGFNLQPSSPAFAITIMSELIDSRPDIYLIAHNNSQAADIDCLSHLNSVKGSYVHSPDADLLSQLEKVFQQGLQY